MTDFFGSIVNFFEVIGNVISQIFNTILMFFQTLTEAIMIPSQLLGLGFLPTIIATSMMVFLAIGAVKLLISIF